MKNLLQLIPAVMLWFNLDPARAQNEPLTVAVFDFSSNNGEVLPRDVTALVTANLSTNTHFVMVERAQIQKALGEQAFGLSGNVNSDAAAKVGLLSGAKVLVVGRVMKLRGVHGIAEPGMVVTARIIGAETGRVFSEKAEGPSTNLLVITTGLSDKIAATIVAQATNLVGAGAPSRQKLIAGIVEKARGKRLPSVSVNVREWTPGEAGLHHTVDNELSMVLQKAGFEVLDEKSDMRPEILITGTAVTDAQERIHNMFSSNATLKLKATDRKTGAIVGMENQEFTAVALGRDAAASRALEAAADELSEKFLPQLAR